MEHTTVMECGSGILPVQFDPPTHQDNTGNLMGRRVRASSRPATGGWIKKVNHLSGSFRPERSRSRRHGILSVAAMVIALPFLAGCEPPTEIIDLRTAPQATWDSMLKIKVIPLGSPTPPGTGAIGPVSGIGCAPASVDASGQAVEQLRVKALRLHATAITDVLIEPGSTLTCPGNYVSVANGMAVGPRAIPSSY